MDAGRQSHWVQVTGWEKWDLTKAGEAAKSFSQFDAEEYDCQISDGF